MSLKIINNFFASIQLKKKHKKVVRSSTNKINKTEFRKKKIKLNYYLIKFIINISFIKSNICLHIMDCSGKSKYLKSSKAINNKLKSLSIQNLENFYKIIVSELDFLKNAPVAIHFNNIEFNYPWLTEKISKKLFLTVLKFYNKHSHNGCRKKKLKRKKFSKKKLLSGLRRQTVNLLKFFIIGSNPIFFNSKYNAVW